MTDLPNVRIIIHGNGDARKVSEYADDLVEFLAAQGLHVVGMTFEQAVVPEADES
jgi:uncharacterized protein YcsI (UPF0317 family)